MKTKRFWKQKATIGALLVSTIMLLTACGGEKTAVQQSVQDSGSAREAAQASASSGVSAPSTRTVRDAEGNTVVIPYEVKRVAASGALNQITLMLGGADRLVATAEGVQKGFFAKVYPGIKEIPAAYAGAGPGTLNMETLIQTAPEVMFGAASNEKDAETLKSANIASLALKLVTVEDIKNTISMVGKVLGPEAEEKAAAFNKYYDDNIKLASERTASAEKLKVFVVSGDGSKGSISTIPAGDINTSYIEAAGGVNVAAETFATGSPEVNLEQVLNWDPDVIIANSRGAFDLITASDSKWKDVRAVKNKSVYLNPKGVYLWSVRSAEGALQPLWLAKTLHPDLFMDVDIKEKIREFYKDYYYYEVSDKEIEEIMNPVN